MKKLSKSVCYTAVCSMFISSFARPKRMYAVRSNENLIVKKTVMCMCEMKSERSTIDSTNC